MNDLPYSPEEKTQLLLDIMAEIKARHQSGNPKFANTVDTLAEYIRQQGIEAFAALDSQLRSITPSPHPLKGELLEAIGASEEGQQLIELVQERTKKMNRRDFLYSSMGHLTMYGAAAAFLGLAEYAQSQDARKPPAIQKMHEERAITFAKYAGGFSALGGILHLLEKREDREQAYRWVENFCMEYSRSGLLPVLSAELQGKKSGISA